LIGHKKELPHRFDGKRYGGYYTQQQIKEVVQYAAERQITIIPEIEMPGHASATLAAYPTLGCTGGPYTTATFWGVFDDVYCAGNDSTFVFLQNVLDEVMALFPSKYIHIGGDECPKTRWKVQNASSGKRPCICSTSMRCRVISFNAWSNTLIIKGGRSLVGMKYWKAVWRPTLLL
jgi:N-acetyl-beta-hexosaminidase